MFRLVTTPRTEAPFPATRGRQHACFTPNGRNYVGASSAPAARVTRSLAAPAPPNGFRYIDDFVAEDEESKLIAELERVDFRAVVMREVAAKRTTAHFGWDYGYETWRIEPAAPIPEWLLPLRERAAALLAMNPEELEEALLTRYPEGAGIGWHRDAPMFGDTVIGLSLGAACVMKFRRKEGEAFVVWKQPLERRSLYVISGEARRVWQHSIATTPALRYSITFRTVRAKR